MEDSREVMKKDCQIVIAVELPVAEAFAALARKEEKSGSSFGRELIIQQLQARGVLPAETIARLLV